MKSLYPLVFDIVPTGQNVQLLMCVPLHWGGTSNHSSAVVQELDSHSPNAAVKPANVQVDNDTVNAN